MKQSPLYLKDVKSIIHGKKIITQKIPTRVYINNEPGVAVPYLISDFSLINQSIMTIKLGEGASIATLIAHDFFQLGSAVQSLKSHHKTLNKKVFYQKPLDLTKMIDIYDEPPLVTEEMIESGEVVMGE